MALTCVCCNRNKNIISRILYSKEECELQVIFYYKLPTEMIRTIGEYLYQPELIKIKYKIKRPPADFDEIDYFIMEDKDVYNCSSCFLYNFIKYKQKHPNTMPRLRNDIYWFVENNKKITTFNEYYDDIFKFELPVAYNMYFYRSFGLTIVKHNGEIIIKEFVQTQKNNEGIFNNDEIKKIIIPEK